MFIVKCIYLFIEWDEKRINFIITINQCSNWEKLNREAQYNDLKTAFQVQNYLTQVTDP
jgi:hypothetical protein